MKLLLPHIAVAALITGCSTSAPTTCAIVSERTFDKFVTQKYVSDPSFPLYTLRMGVILGVDGRTISVRCADAVDNRKNWTRSTKLDLPPELLRVAAAHIDTKHFSPRIAGGRPQEFYVHFFYSPREPKLLLPGFP